MLMTTLHRNRNMTALMPRYVERFRCIGANCEDTCCAGWPVHIDKKTYKAYRNHKDPALKPVVAFMQRIDNPPHAGMYAVLPIFGPGGDCPALQDGKCAIQSSAGASYLSDTCDSYPRINRHINGHSEQSMTMSCPEVARLALLDEDAFEFIEASVSIREGTLFTTPDTPGMEPELANEARIFCLNLMRTRELDLWQRLAMLGAFCETLDLVRSTEIGEPMRVQTMINDFILNIENGALSTAIEPIRSNHEAQAMIFATLWASKGFARPSPHQQTQMTLIAAGLGGNASGQVSGTDLVAAYRRGLDRLDIAIADTPWLLENYLLNEMFAHQFPVGSSSAYDSFLRLFSRFGLLRFLLAARCNADDVLPSPSMLTATVGLQARRFQHDRQFAEEVNRSLHESGWADLAKLNTLIRT